MATTSEPYDYHRDFARISHSMLKVFRRSRPRYKAIYVDRTLQPPEPTDAMIRGTLLHLLKLEPELWDEQFVMVPETAPDGKKWLRRKGSDHERWWAEFLEANRGKVQADAKTEAEARGMAAALIASRDIRRLLEDGGPTEHVLRWTDKETGLECRAKLDKWAVNWGVILDLKSTTNCTPEAFARTIEDNNYFTQAAFYLRGASETSAVDDAFAFAAVESKAPYDTGIFDLHEDWLTAGRDQNHRTLKALAECMESGDWRNPWEKEPKTLSRPGWAEKNQELWEGWQCQ